jgi:hypothetical protein
LDVAVELDVADELDAALELDVAEAELEDSATALPFWFFPALAAISSRRPNGVASTTARARNTARTKTFKLKRMTKKQARTTRAV